MPDANILFKSVAPANVGDAIQHGMQTAQGFNQLKQMPVINQILQQKAQIGKTAVDQEAAKFQLQDAAMDSMQLRPLLDSGDLTRFKAGMASRIAKIKTRGGDSQHTQALLDGLNDGTLTPQQVSAELQSVENAASRAGLINPAEDQSLRAREIQLRERSINQNADQFAQRMQLERDQMAMGRNINKPSAVAEWEYYSKLDPQKRAEYDAMKRGTPGYSAVTEKQIYGAADAYVQDNAAFENYMDLANRYQQSAGKLSSGAAAGAKEWLKEFTGNEDEFTALRKDWSQIKASEVVRNLPPGAASDSDIKMALSGFIGNNASPEEVAAKLRGMAKLRKLGAEYNAFKADYLSNNKNPGGLLNAWQSKAKEMGLSGASSSSAQDRTVQPSSSQIQQGTTGAIKFLGFEQ